MRGGPVQELGEYGGDNSRATRELSPIGRQSPRLDGVVEAHTCKLIPAAQCDVW